MDEPEEYYYYYYFQRCRRTPSQSSQKCGIPLRASQFCRSDSQSSQLCLSVQTGSDTDESNEESITSELRDMFSLQEGPEQCETRMYPRSNVASSTELVSYRVTIMPCSYIMTVRRTETLRKNLNKLCGNQYSVAQHSLFKFFLKLSTNDVEDFLKVT